VGRVSIQTVRVEGQAPSIRLLNSIGKDLLDVVPARDEFWVVHDMQDPGGPYTYYGLVHASPLPSPLLLVVYWYGTATDCGFKTALVGAIDGKLKVLTPDLPTFFTRGGAYLEAHSNGFPARLTIAAERYQANDVHYKGPSIMAVYTYNYDAESGMFKLVKLEELPTAKVKLKGENLLLAIPNLPGC
jgi:hypothetical protein